MTEKKKRLLVLVAIFALVVSVAVLMTACGGSSGGSGGSSSKTVSGIEVSIANGSTLTVGEGGEIVVNVGEIPSFAKEDFRVIPVYTDGTKGKAITSYTFDASLLPANVEEGTYTIEFTYKKLNYFLTVRVVGAEKIALLPINTSAEYKYEYTGQPIDVIAKLDESRAEADKLATIISSGKATVSQQQGQNDRVATNAGYYGLCLTAAAGYEWKDENNVSETLMISWQITPKVLPLPTVTGERSYEFTGSEITLAVDLHGFGDQITLANGGDTNKGLHSGTYALQAMIKPEHQTNYTFDVDGTVTTGPVELGTWTITKKVLPIPEITNAKSTSTNEGMTYYHFDYTGANIAITTNVDEASEYIVTKNNGEAITDVLYEGGSYWIVVDLNSHPAEQTEDFSNDYCWSDGSQITSTTFYVVVDPIDYEVPAAVASAILTLEGTYLYSGSYEFGESDGMVNLTDETYELLTENDVLIENESYLVYKDEAVYAAGTKNLTYSFIRSRNYKPMDVQFSVTIAPSKIVASNANWNGRQNTLEQDNWHNVGQGNFVYNGRAQRKALSVETSSYTMMDEGLYPKVTYTVYYGATENTINLDAPIQTIEVTSDERGPFLYEYVGVASADAGYYRTVATLSIASGNYVFVNENQQEANTFVTNWQIEKATVTVVPSFLGTLCSWNGSYYTGTNKTISLEDYSVTILTYYDNSGYQHAWYSGSDFNKNTYVDVDDEIAIYYYDNGAWVDAAGDTAAVGQYKTHVTASLKEGLAANYTIVCEDKEWTVYPNTYDLSSITWNNLGSYAYREGTPTVTGLPEGLTVSYMLEYEGGFHYGSVGANRIVATIEANSYVDGYEGVVITKPAGWEYGEDYGHNELQYRIVGSADFTVTKKLFTMADFYLTIDGEKLESPFEVEYEEWNYRSVGIGCDGEWITSGTIAVERGDWNADGHGHYNNYGEIGNYTFSGFLYVMEDPNGNYGFDEGQEYVRLLTEDYVYPNAEDPTFVLKVEDESSYPIGVTPTVLTYKYVLDFSFDWSIVAPAE